ncbi:hypothetical protein BDP27DRAFT_413861 [Rhodocollybia butyracea]|uniref:FAD-binding domain-containing protein n=1 Tax=Rhodocollybia butyracea TaxID=206335 RepID=A0A9P5Q062_9AGAR|nr:hypothetical protein BDP27DRAFT_413861 [Rhodocollybia butyracea]
MYKILQDWGIEDEFKKISSKPDTINMLSFAGWYLGSFRWDSEVLKETRGEFGLTTYGALQALLYRTALSSGASIRFGAKVVSLSPCSKYPSVTLACGEVIHADVLVGADGVNGVTRKYITSNEGVSKETGIGAERADLCMFSVSIPKQSILEDPELAYLINRRNNDMFVWLGYTSAAVGFPSGESCDFSLYVYGPDDQTRDLPSILRGAEPSLIKLARLATGFHGHSEHRTPTPLAHEYVLDKWTEDKLVVIGEAAHPLPVSVTARPAFYILLILFLSARFSTILRIIG